MKVWFVEFSIRLPKNGLVYWRFSEEFDVTALLVRVEMPDATGSLRSQWRMAGAFGRIAAHRHRLNSNCGVELVSNKTGH